MARSINLKNWILLDQMKIHSGIDEEPKLETYKNLRFGDYTKDTL